MTWPLLRRRPHSAVLFNQDLCPHLLMMLLPPVGNVAQVAHEVSAQRKHLIAHAAPRPHAPQVRHLLLQQPPVIEAGLLHKERERCVCVCVCADYLAATIGAPPVISVCGVLAGHATLLRCFLSPAKPALCGYCLVNTVFYTLLENADAEH